MMKSDYGLVSCWSELRLLEKLDKELDEKRRNEERMKEVRNNGQR